MPKILLAEDDKVISDSLSDGLRQGGYEVIQAFDGDEAVAKAQSEIPDLALLDVMMPKRDGVAVLNEIKAKPETSKIPVIVLTNLSDVDTISKIVTGGAVDYLVKSDQTVDSILEKVNQLLKKS